MNVHVVIPVYNCKGYVKEAVDSVLNQPYQNIDVVLIDDGSEDGSFEVCDEIAEENARIYVIHQKNAGVSFARNHGIDFILEKYRKNLDGHYIAFLDADDCWEKCFLDNSVWELLRKNFDLIGLQSCDCNEKMVKRTEPKILKEDVFRGGAANVWMHSSSSFGAMFYSCKLLDKYGVRFPVQLKYSEDKIFSMQCMYLAEAIYQKNILMYLYRINANSAMGKRKFGIPYYGPIISGYLNMDREMEKWANDKRGILLEGRRCANRYIMEMICEHYQQLGRKKTLDLFLASNPEIVDVVNGKGEYHILQQNLEYKKYIENPKKYIVKMYIRGISFHFARCIQRAIIKFFK